MKIFIALIFTIFSLNVSAQIKTDYDTLQDYRMERMQLHLERFHKTYSTGAALYVGGLALAGVGLAGSKVNVPIVGLGGGLNLLGTIVMMTAHKEIYRASQVRRAKKKK